MTRHHDIRSEQGQTMTEFAVVLPVLVLIVFAVIQFGLLFNHYVALTDAVRAGARVAAVSEFSSDPVGATTAKVKAASGDLNTTQVGVTVNSTWAHGADVQVTATYPYSISLFGVVVKSGNLSSTTTERVE